MNKKSRGGGEVVAALVLTTYSAIYYGVSWWVVVLAIAVLVAIGVATAVVAADVTIVREHNERAMKRAAEIRRKGYWVGLHKSRLSWWLPVKTIVLLEVAEDNNGQPGERLGMEMAPMTTRSKG